MPHFCVSTDAQPLTGDHEVHDLGSTKGCLPSAWNRRDLGWHDTCTGAVAAAQRLYRAVNGCAHCAVECHTS